MKREDQPIDLRDRINQEQHRHWILRFWQLIADLKGPRTQVARDIRNEADGVQRRIARIQKQINTPDHQ